MDAINHIVRNGNLQIAMIQGTQIRSWCGLRYVPEVWVGTSGSAAKPEAPTCERCLDVVAEWKEFIRLKDEQERLLLEMSAIKERQAARQDEWAAERDRVPELAP